MSKYKIKVVNEKGESREEILEAVDQASLYTIVRQKGDTLISLEEITSKSGHGFNFEISFLSRVKTTDKIAFTRNLGAMIDAGLSMSRALAVIEKQTKQKKFKSIIISVESHISQGKTLSESLAEYPTIFPQLMISMVKAGEESGSLSQSLRTVASQMENSYLLSKKIRGALMYPGVILFAMVIIGFFMLTYVVPTLSATFKELHADLPIQTKIVIGASDFLKQHIILTLIAVIAIVLGFYFGKRTKAGQRFIDWFVLRVPIIGSLVKEVNSARTARTLSSLLSAGVDVVVATQITREVLQNSYYKDVMKLVEEKIQKGEPIANIFNAHEHLYPIFVGEMVSVGEETGQLAQMLLGVASFYEGDVDQRTKDMSSIIEPFLMIFIGLGVGFFAISMISPIYSLSNNF
jgi:type IV pilus assembly protein PilC